MKETYIAPDVEIVPIDAEDIILSSGPGGSESVNSPAE